MATFDATLADADAQGLSAQTVIPNTVSASLASADATGLSGEVTFYDGDEYHNRIMLDQPESFWRHNDASGGLDDELDVNHGEENGSPIYGQDGVLTQAIRFEGSEHFLLDNFCEVAQWTATGWIKANSDESGAIISKGSSQNHFTSLWILSDGRFQAIMRHSTRYPSVTSDEGGYNDGEWHHFAALFNGNNGNIKIYADGHLIMDKNSHAVGAPSYSAGAIGRMQRGDASGSNLTGTTDEIAVFPHHLSVNSIQKQASIPPRDYSIEATATVSYTVRREQPETTISATANLDYEFVPATVGPDVTIDATAMVTIDDPSVIRDASGSATITLSATSDSEMEVPPTEPPDDLRTEFIKRVSLTMPPTRIQDLDRYGRP